MFFFDYAMYAIEKTPFLMQAIVCVSSARRRVDHSLSIAPEPVFNILSTLPIPLSYRDPEATVMPFFDLVTEPLALWLGDSRMHSRGDSLIHNIFLTYWP